MTSRRRTAMLLALCTLVALFVGAALWQAPRIEDKVANGANERLTAENLEGLDLAIDGRDVKLSGAIFVGEPFYEDAEGLRSAVGDADGVRWVDVGGIRSLAETSTPTPVPVTAVPATPTTAPPQPTPTPTADSTAAQAAFEAFSAYDPSEVGFEPGTATLTTVAKASLDLLASLLSGEVSFKLEVASHTDTEGDQAQNQALSQEQAEAVVAYLVSEGVSASRLVASGYGGSQPVHDNNTDEGRRMNRRVEFILQEG